jgi:hypothetical protein
LNSEEEVFGMGEIIQISTHPAYRTLGQRAAEALLKPVDLRAPIPLPDHLCFEELEPDLDLDHVDLGINFDILYATSGYQHGSWPGEEP